MKKRAAIFSHADADGHIIAVQTYRNLLKDRFHIDRVIVDPKTTKNCKFWETHFQEADFGESNYIFITDIMFDRINLRRSYEALCDRAAEESMRKFIIIDHHPLEMPEKIPKNVDIIFVENVFECCYGKPSELMYLAAICDKEASKVKEHITDWHLKISKGIKRAVTERKYIAGPILLSLIQDEKWFIFERLADEPCEMHRTMYGHRTSKIMRSPTIKSIRKSKEIIKLCAG